MLFIIQCGEEVNWGRPLRLPGYAGGHARAEDGRGQRGGGNPDRDEGLLQGGLQRGEPL